MKKREALAEVERFVRHYREALGVDPRIKINVEWDPDLVAYAEVNQMSRRRVATVLVGTMYGKQSLRDRRQTIIHELLHVAQNGVLASIHEANDAEHLPDELFLNVIREHELFTDTLAETLVDLLPSP